MDYEKLCALAVSAADKAYAPYSGYKVGAALLCADGKVYLGSNIENASYTPTVCAERVAFFKAISEGERDFVAIAVCGGKGGEVTDVFPPCGVCRQVMAEFCDFNNFDILMVNKNSFVQVKLKDLLPYGFSGKFIEN